MGSAEPRSFSRGKRGVSGSLIFIVFDRDALLETLLMNLRDRNKSTTDQTGALEIFNPAAEVGQNPPVYGIRDWNRVMSESQNRHVALDHNTIKYLDQFPPFLNFAV